MHTLTDPMIIRQVITERHKSPQYKKTPQNIDKFVKIHMNSANCIDDIMIYLNIENDVIKEAFFDGVACAISTASTDILCELITNKTIEEVDYIIKQYNNMIFEKEFDEDVLEEAIVFINTSKQAARIKCATIGFNGVEELLRNK